MTADRLDAHRSSWNGAATDMSRNAVELIDAQVRDLVRREGIDPLRDPGAVNHLVATVVREYDERSLTGVVPPIGDLEAVSREVHDRVAGFGPLQRYLDDPTVEEIWINEPSRVFIAREGRHELTTTVLTEEEVGDLVERMLKTTGRRIDVSQPFTDARLPDGSRVHIVLGGITQRYAAINIRKFTVRATRLTDMVQLGSLTPHAAAVLEASVAVGLNVLVSGGTQAGKTTMLNALAGSIPGSERVISCEEVFEIKLPIPDWVSMQTRQAGLEGTGEVRLRDLVKESLRMRPSRMIVGEVRGEECLDLLLALNSGLPGMCTIHANSAREALTKMCTLPLLAGENIGSRFVLPTVAGCVDIVVHLGVAADGRRRVREIVAVTGRVEEQAIETETLFSTRDGYLRRAEGQLPHTERFQQAGYNVAGLLTELPRRGA
ncbi:pilus assembly protein CpaF [Kribbella aluminosa]|uniref:Pilus assembly protein CpaF n=1 Tax=Kribbella aluminosa TaxID=416017 RepID=A0ABS4UV19_9ACTN|nr:ATPase, T2SS/T4P/T4SS family [Kribbella aluminosa]MBP2355499.1 pilus assembly protein CpaF [Kribbella aluminosa]